MLDLYSQGLNATTMTELSIILALHGPSGSVEHKRCGRRRLPLAAAWCYHGLSAT